MAHGQPPNHRRDIDGLRALAVLSVVLFHAFPAGMPGGFVGVDVFFVISGFLISKIILDALLDGSFSFVDFYMRRIRRLMPALLLVLMSCMAFAWFTSLASDLKLIGKHVVAAVLMGANWLFWSEAGYFDDAVENKPLIHFWSLAVEEQFYAVWPLALWWAWKRGINILRFACFCVAASFFMSIYEVGVDAVSAFYLPQYRFWEILCGGVLAIWASGANHRHWGGGNCNRPGALVQQQGTANALSCTGMLLLALGVFGLNKGLRFPGFWALVPVSGALCIISAGPHAWGNRIMLSGNLMVWLGKISYPLYLWHWPLFAFARIVNGGVPSVVERVILLIVAMVLAWLTQAGLERRLRWGGHGRTKAAVLVAVACGVFVVGGILFRSDGFASRLPVEVRSILAPPAFPYEKFTSVRHCTPYPEFNRFQVCREKERPSVFLMGDSHADALSLGLNHLQKRHIFGLDVAVGCGNVPYLTPAQYGDNAWCGAAEVRAGFNRFSIDEILRRRPDVVVLHARWAYGLYRTDQREMVERLRETVTRIKDVSPESRVVVVGPVPNWKTKPQDELYRAWRMSRVKLAEAMPSRIDTGLVAEVADWDRFMELEVPKMGAQYVSAYRVFCNSQGCLARVGATANDVTAWDYGHLSPAGAIYLAEHLQDALFSLMPQRPVLRVHDGL